MEWSEYWTPVLLTIRIAIIAGFVATVVGMAAARWLAYRRGMWPIFIDTLLMLPLVLPPSVVGFLLLILLGRQSWIGRFADWLFASPILFTWWAALIAAIVVAFPLAYQTVKVGIRSIDRSLLEAARSDGAGEWRVFWTITIPLAKRSVVTAYILGFARGLGEFGATLMIAGNIPGKTQTIATAVYVAIDSGQLTLAWAWTMTMIMISFMLLALTRQQRAA